jgi:hypothetical protein
MSQSYPQLKSFFVIPTKNQCNNQNVSNESRKPYDCNNFTNTCTIHLFITYTRLHVSASPGHHQGVTDYQGLQIKMRKYE